MKISLFYVIWFENKVVELQIRTLFLGAESSFSEKGSEPDLVRALGSESLWNLKTSIRCIAKIQLHLNSS